MTWDKNTSILEGVSLFDIMQAIFLPVVHAAVSTSALVVVIVVVVVVAAAAAAAAAAVVVVVVVVDDIDVALNGPCARG